MDTDMQQFADALNQQHELREKALAAAREVWRYWSEPHYETRGSVELLFRTLGDALAQLDAAPPVWQDDTRPVQVRE